MVQVYPHTGVHALFAGDFFRGLWGPHAGWAQAVSTPLPGTLAPHPMPLPCPPHYLPTPGPVLCRPPQGPEASLQLASGLGELRLGQLWEWAPLGTLQEEQ